MNLTKTLLAVMFKYNVEMQHYNITWVHLEVANSIFISDWSQLRLKCPITTVIQEPKYTCILSGTALLMPLQKQYKVNPFCYGTTDECSPHPPPIDLPYPCSMQNNKALSTLLRFSYMNMFRLGYICFHSSTLSRVMHT